METLLNEGLEKLGIELDDRQRRQLALYRQELELWNGKYGLVNAAGDELTVKHFLDSLSAVPHVRKMNFASACDVGSGGGFPGMVMAIVFPDRKFSLIERSGRKSAFLANTAVMINAPNVEVISRDAGLVKEKYDIVFFRALGKFHEYFPTLYNLAAPGGSLFAFKGKRTEAEKEIAMLPEEIRKYAAVIGAEVPFLEDERNFVRIEKRGAL